MTAKPPAHHDIMLRNEIMASCRIFSGAANMVKKGFGKERSEKCKYCENNGYTCIVYSEWAKEELRSGLGQATDECVCCYHRGRPCKSMKLFYLLVVERGYLPDWKVLKALTVRHTVEQTLLRIRKGFERPPGCCRRSFVYLFSQDFDVTVVLRTLEVLGDQRPFSLLKPSSRT
jgi:hypothetical protein